MIDLRPYYIGEWQWTTAATTTIDPQIRREGKGSVETSTGQKVAPKTVHTQYGCSTDPMQLRKQSTITAQHASLGTSSTGSTQKGILIAPTGHDSRKIPCNRDFGQGAHRRRTHTSRRTRQSWIRTPASTGKQLKYPRRTQQSPGRSKRTGYTWDMGNGCKGRLS